MSLITFAAASLIADALGVELNFRRGDIGLIERGDVGVVVVVLNVRGDVGVIGDVLRGDNPGRDTNGRLTIGRDIVGVVGVMGVDGVGAERRRTSVGVAARVVMKVLWRRPSANEDEKARDMMQTDEERGRCCLKSTRIGKHTALS